jgi:dTDP-4-dehydrorhamnose 3,5-epimerase-like enzyme
MNENEEAETPFLSEGGLNVDDRGDVAFANDFKFDGVKRFYLVSNHRSGFVRAWHAHRREAKYVMLVQGSAIVAAVLIDDWERPSKEAQVHRYVLSSNKPAVLYIPAGYANGFMSLTSDAKLMFFSTSSMEETRGDDVRYDAHYWDPWQVIER